MTNSHSCGEGTVVVENKKASQGATTDMQDRARLYHQYFVPQIARAEKQAEFIQQVNGYGVQVFAQASSFKSL
jgi:hypothetical protein